MKPEVAIKVSHKYFSTHNLRICRDCQYTCVIDQFLFCVFVNQDEFEVNNNTKENETNIQHLDRTSLVSKRIFSCGTNAGNPEQAGWAHLARSGSQSERRIRFTFPACRFSHIILLVRILCLVLVLFRG